MLNRLTEASDLKVKPPEAEEEWPLHEQLNDLLRMIADASKRADCGDTLDELALCYELVTSFLKKYATLQAEVKRLRSQVMPLALLF
jgi:hypothetical protein